jgi:SAM-dependent methyltransferase
MDRGHDIAAELGRSIQQHRSGGGLEARALQLSTGGTNTNIASEQDVIMAYRLILGREPENAAVVQNIVGKQISFTEMRDNFIRSAEFRQNVILSRIGGMLKPLDWNANSIETKVDDDTLALLYKHTEKVWSNLGIEEPHYSVVTNYKFKPGTFKEHAAEFYASGGSSLRVFKKTLERHSIDISQYKDCFELGCGVGRVTLKLAEIFPKVIAADISAPHLELARSALTPLAQDVVEFRKLESIRSLELLPNFDVFYSVIVLQHNPPPVIGVLLKTILSKLRAGGIAYFQVPTYALGYHFDCKTYLRRFRHHTRMEMHVFPQRELFELIRERDCRVVEMREDNYVGTGNMISNSILVIKSSAG